MKSEENLMLIKNHSGEQLINKKEITAIIVDEQEEMS